MILNIFNLNQALWDPLLCQASFCFHYLILRGTQNLKKGPRLDRVEWHIWRARAVTIYQIKSQHFNILTLRTSVPVCASWISEMYLELQISNSNHSLCMRSRVNISWTEKINLVYEFSYFSIFAHKTSLGLLFSFSTIYIQLIFCESVAIPALLLSLPRIP